MAYNFEKRVQKRGGIGMSVYKMKRYFALALDPIHVGTGGYRIGRVDNTIVREPATGIPKIPGTTIEGVCRSYAFFKAKENEEWLKPECAKGKTKDDKEPCGKCRICITFGYTTKNKSLQAMALLPDVRILFFPVATMIGPVWVTCSMVLRDAEISLNGDEDCLKELEKENNDGTVEHTFVATAELDKKLPKSNGNKILNFSWLLLVKKSSSNTTPSNWSFSDSFNSNKKLSETNNMNEILSRIVIVPNTLFATIVNSNLEVRTSVAIDPERGAVEERALFTYEAIPRGTVFWFDATFQNPKHFPAIPEKIKIKENEEKEVNIELLTETVKNGLELFEHLGVGGMSSRGFGRLKILNL